MEIYIDGEMRGAYTTKETRLWGANSVSANYFVKLLPSDKGKTIDFFSVTDSNYSGVLSEIYGGTVFGIYAQFVKNNIFETVSALMILILSIVTIIISEYLRIKQHTGIYLAYLGWTELLLSIWILSESPLRQLYFENISLAGYMTHFAVYLLALPVIFFFDCVQKHRYTKVYRVLLMAELGFSVIASVLEITGMAGFTVLFYIAVILYLIGTACVVATFIMDIKRGYAKEYRLVCWGFLGFVVSGVFQISMYLQRTSAFHGGFLNIGALFWLVMTVFSTIRDYFELEKENVENRIRAEKLTSQSMKTLVQTIEAKDTYTKGHSTRVARYAALLAEKMGMSKEEQNEIHYMGMLHDIGKIGISDNIINKPGRLTDEEYELVKTHADIGYRILENMNEIKNIEYGARWHHERYDGRGYPDGLAGEEIERVSGSQLDPKVAACMLQLIDEDTEYELCQRD